MRDTRCPRNPARPAIRRTEAGTIAELRAELLARGGALAEALAPGRAVRMALNQMLAHEHAGLSEGDEVAFFPPVTGG